MCVSVTAERDEGRGRSKKEQNPQALVAWEFLNSHGCLRSGEGRHVPRTLKVLMVLSVTLEADKLMFRIKFIPYSFRN